MIERITNIYTELAQKKWDRPFQYALLAFEAIICIAILHFIKYTEIDWEAYMEEVSTWQNGERDYMNIRGGTGPLVYPAGFLYLYGFFKWMSNGGTNIFSAQCAFCILYIINAALVLEIYTIIVDKERQRLKKEKEERKEKKQQTGKSSKKANVCLKVENTVWSWRVGMSLLCLSKRIHSIFILRLFNDAPCMFLFYISVYLFMKGKFRIGCFFFSLAVSVKMNVLLFAPGLLLLLLQHNSTLMGTIECLSICAFVQIVLGAPFLLTYPESYIRKAFEFDRVFFFKWTVNWKFLQEDTFISKPLSITLLMLHISTLVFFAKKWIDISRKRRRNNGKSICLGPRLDQTYIAYTLFVSNFIGIVFARTLHYQFYSWYFHTVPLLLWMTDLPLLTKIVVMGLIEYAFNVFPATSMSSASLQFAHFVTLISLWKAKFPCIITSQEQS